MPIPPTDPIPLPSDESDSARVFLESHGLIPLQPLIRSSDDSLLCDPFRYYLTRRLGLVSCFSYSVALNRGTWFHTCAQAHHESDPSSFLADALTNRISELKNACETLSVLPTAASAILARERRDHDTAYAWWTAASSVRFGPHTLPTYFAPYRHVASELVLHHDLLLDGVHYPLVCTVDRLLLDEKTGLLHILDYKTCSEPPSIRLAKCPLELQTSLYSFIVSELLTSGELQRTLSLPASTRFGGMFHAAIQKPTIRLGMNDRPFIDKPFTPTRGPNKGVTRMEREYTGEPTLANYLARCERWYLSLDEFSGSPHSEPPVNVSHIAPSFIRSPLLLKDLFTRIRRIHSYATRPANPDLFRKNPDGLFNHNSTTFSPYAPFYLRPVHEWPAIIAESRFVVDHRDDPDDSPLTPE